MNINANITSITGRAVKALRGATTVNADVAAEIDNGSAELVAEVMQRNQLKAEDIISIIFTVTTDIKSAFPATGARGLGLGNVPLICATEIPVPGSQALCIRCLVHAYLPADTAPIHVYMRAARALRPDLATPAARQLPTHRAAIERIEPYVPGKPIEEVQAELGLTDVCKLASNENSLGPSPMALAALAQTAGNLHRYPDGGVKNLRQALADYLRVAPNQIFVGNGSDEVIKLLAEVYLNPGDEVIFAAQTFSEYAYATRLMGATEVTVPLRQGVHDLPAMLAQVTSRTKLVFVCNPNNPTGTYVGTAQLIDFMRQLPPGVLVVCDEAYGEYVDAPNFPNTIALIKAGYPVASLRTFSKIYGLAGIRVGYAIAPVEVAQRLSQVKEPFNVNLLAQAAAVAALGDSTHIQRSRELNAEGKQQLYAGLSALRLRYLPTQANFICVDVGRPASEVYQAMLQQGVIIRAGASFGLPTCVRITIGTKEENERCLRVLQQALAVK